MNRMLLLPILLFLAGSPALAQTPVQRAKHWPDAAVVVQQFLDGKQSVAIATALRTCPERNPYGDTVWVALLETERTPDLVSRLASAWSEALRSCNDPRIESWYRARLRESTDLLSGSSVLFALIRHDTPESVELLKRVAYDESRDQQLRSQILGGLARKWDTRMSIYLEAVVQTERLPEPYREDEWSALTGSPVAESFANRALQVIPQHPGRNAAWLLVRLAGLDRVRATPDLRNGLAALTRAILNAPPGRYPPELTNAAMNAQEALERRR